MQGSPQQNHLVFHLPHPPLATLPRRIRRSPSPPTVRRAAPTQSPRRRRNGSGSAIDRKPLHGLHRRIRRVPELRRRTIHRRYQSHRRLVRSAARILNRSAATDEPEHCDQQRRNLIHSHCLETFQNESVLSPNTESPKTAGQPAEEKFVLFRRPKSFPGAHRSRTTIHRYAAHHAAVLIQT